MGKKIWLLALVGCVLVLATRTYTSGQSGLPTSDITLTVTDWSNIARTSEPVTTGVPIPLDAVGASWALENDAGQQVPLQVKVLDGIKTPWLLLDFQSTNSANQAKQYILKQQTPTATHSNPLVFSDNGTQITVGNGLIQTLISKSTFNLFETVWRDQDGDNILEGGEEIVTASPGNLTITDVSVLNGGSGLVYTSEASSFVWEYEGSLRRTLRVEGSYKNINSALPNDTLLDFTTRITWYAGQTHVKIEHLIRNTSATNERWVKLTSAKLNIGTSTTTDRIARSGDLIWSNRSAGTSVQLLPTTLDISDQHNPYGGPGAPQSERTKYPQPINIDTNGGMIIGDLSYHGASVQLDFASGSCAGELCAAEKTRRTAAAKDQLMALAPEAHYSDLSAFGAEHFGTYQDEKDTYTKWGQTWPTANPWNPWSYEHDRPRVQDMYVTWLQLSSQDFEADELWQNIMMLTRVRLPYYLDRLRTYARFWNWEWTYRSDGYAFNGSWPFNPNVYWAGYWYYGNETSRPVVQPTLTAADTDFINHDVKSAKADTTHMWNSGSIDYYYLTGDKDSLQAAIDMAEECKLLFYGPNYTHTVALTGIRGTGSRGTIRCLQIFTRTWEATNDQQWKTAADGMLPYFLQSPNYDHQIVNGVQRGFFYNQPCSLHPGECDPHPNGKSFAGFPTAVAVDALYRYYLLTNNQAVKTQILEIAGYMRDIALDPVTGFGGASYIVDDPNPGDVYRSPDNRASRDFVNTMVIGYRLTGDSSYLTKAKLAWQRGTDATDTRVGRWENSLQGWDPYGSLFPEGGDLNYSSFLFYDAARQDLLAPAAVTDLRVQ